MNGETLLCDPWDKYVAVISAQSYYAGATPKTSLLDFPSRISAHRWRIRGRYCSRSFLFQASPPGAFALTHTGG